MRQLPAPRARAAGRRLDLPCAQPTARPEGPVARRLRPPNRHPRGLRRRSRNLGVHTLAARARTRRLGPLLRRRHNRRRDLASSPLLPKQPRRAQAGTPASRARRQRHDRPSATLRPSLRDARCRLYALLDAGRKAGRKGGHHRLARSYPSGPLGRRSRGCALALRGYARGATRQPPHHPLRDLPRGGRNSPRHPTAALASSTASARMPMGRTPSMPPSACSACSKWRQGSVRRAARSTPLS